MNTRSAEQSARSPLVRDMIVVDPEFVGTKHFIPVALQPYRQSPSTSGMVTTQHQRFAVEQKPDAGDEQSIGTVTFGSGHGTLLTSKRYPCRGSGLKAPGANSIEHEILVDVLDAVLLAVETVEAEAVTDTVDTAVVDEVLPVTDAEAVAVDTAVVEVLPVADEEAVADEVVVLVSDKVKVIGPRRTGLPASSATTTPASSSSQAPSGTSQEARSTTARTKKNFMVKPSFLQ